MDCSYYSYIKLQPPEANLKLVSENYATVTKEYDKAFIKKAEERYDSKAVACFINTFVLAILTIGAVGDGLPGVAAALFVGGLASSLYGLYVYSKGIAYENEVFLKRKEVMLKIFEDMTAYVKQKTGYYSNEFASIAQTISQRKFSQQFSHFKDLEIACSNYLTNNGKRY